MDMVEGLAIGEPLCAKALALNAIDKVDGERGVKYEALKLVIPPVCAFPLSLPFFPLLVFWGFEFLRGQGRRGYKG